MQAGWREGKRSQQQSPAQRRAVEPVSRAPALTILTMPRCTVGTAGPPEEPPLCTEEAMCGDGKAVSKTADRREGVNVGIGVGERAPRRGAGRRRSAGD